MQDTIQQVKPMPMELTSICTLLEHLDDHTWLCVMASIVIAKYWHGLDFAMVFFGTILQVLNSQGFAMPYHKVTH